jgi:hypothetical protein
MLNKRKAQKSKPQDASFTPEIFPFLAIKLGR